MLTLGEEPLCGKWTAQEEIVRLMIEEQWGYGKAFPTCRRCARVLAADAGVVA